MRALFAEGVHRSGNSWYVRDDKVPERPSITTSAIWREYEKKMSLSYLPDIEMAENSSKAFFYNCKVAGTIKQLCQSKSLW